MAIVKPGPMVGSQRGTVGTLVLQGGPYGCVAHAKGRRVETDSGMKGDATQRFYRAVAGWRKLSAETRTAWNTYAAHSVGAGQKGQWGAMSGRQAFISASVMQELAHGAGTVAIPKAGLLQPLETFSVVPTETGPSMPLVFSPAPLADDEWLFFWMAAFRSSGAHIPGSGWWGPIAIGPGIPSGIDIGPGYASVTDIFQEGRVLGMRGAKYSGTLKRVSKPLEVRAVVQA